MAARPIEPATPDVVDQVLLIPVDEIELGERLRPVDHVFAEGIGRSMMVDGQITPIDVCRLPGREGWTLVAGGHRLVGARIVGMAYLRAIVVSADRADRRMREIQENLLRRGLDPIERATFVADMYDLLRARSGIDPSASPQQVAANARWQKVVKNEADDTSAIVADVYGWTDEIAETAGFSRRTIEYDLMLHRRLAPRTVELLREHSHPVLINASQLRQLARLEEREQIGVAEYLCLPGKALGRPQPKTVADAVAMQRNAPKQVRSAEEKRLSAFIGSFARMSLAEKKGALAQLGGMAPIRSNLKRCRHGRKVARANAFCEGWAFSVYRKIAQLAPAPAEDELVSTYLVERHPGLVHISSRSGAAKRTSDDRLRGAVQGSKVDLNKGVGGSSGTPLLVSQA